MRLARTLLLALPALFPLPNAHAAQVEAPPSTVADDLGGRWVFDIPQPGKVELSSVALVLTREGESGLQALIETADGVVAGAGSWDAATRRLMITAQAGPDASGVLELELREGHLLGTLEMFAARIPVDAVRPSEESEAEPAIVVDFQVERPATISLEGLSGELASEATRILERLVHRKRAVGLSAAFVVAGELIDVRSYGWEDFGQGVPASGETMYRWASIAKPVTAVAALQLVEQGQLDLDQDAREHVPEFPEQAHVFTPRQLLCHQAGVVHYQHMGIRTLREYEIEHPWADPIIALDMFNERELLFEPGTDYSYTTPGFVILGAVIERAGGKSYVEQVTERICAPLGMTTMQPDREWVEIPHRSRGYVRRADWKMVDSGSDDISWKLAAGGWISTAGDLARFGIGLMGDSLLEAGTREQMWTDQATASGETNGYGLGIGVSEIDGLRIVSHSGGQKKASTHLIVCPERRVAVALMCNTQGTPLSDPARDLLRLLIE